MQNAPKIRMNTELRNKLFNKIKHVFLWAAINPIWSTFLSRQPSPWKYALSWCVAKPRHNHWVVLNLACVSMLGTHDSAALSDWRFDRRHYLYGPLPRIVHSQFGSDRLEQALSHFLEHCCSCSSLVVFQIMFILSHVALASGGATLVVRS